MDAKILMSVLIMLVTPMLSASTLRAVSCVLVNLDSVEMEASALISTNAKSVTHADHKGHDVSILLGHTDVFVNKDSKVSLHFNFPCFLK